MILGRNQFFMVLVAVLVLPFYAYKLIWVARSERVVGKVWFLGHTLEDLGNITQHMVIAFQAGRDTVTFNAGDNLGLSVGEPIAVRYQPSNPSDARIDTALSVWGDTWVNSFLPIGILLVLFFTPDRFDPLIPRRCRVRLGWRRPWLRLILVGVLVLIVNVARSCSMFKITFLGKTMVGNNEDAWRENSQISFEVGRDGGYGAAYVSHEDAFPQGGLNEAGLMYDGFAVYRRPLRSMAGKKKVADSGDFLFFVLQHCATVVEVRDLVNQYDRSRFNGSMLLYVDKKGDYLVVEADTTILGHDAKYVLSNFCPSVTARPLAVPIGRYQRGLRFLEHKEDTSLRFCTAMMDTMHECRARFGDGTTYTTIYDLAGKLVYLYFYHDYTHCVRFDLAAELAKGDHHLLIKDLFPRNAEYERFVHFKTPFNDAGLAWVLRGDLLALSALLVWCFCLFVMGFRRRSSAYRTGAYRFVWLAFMLVNLGLVYYALQLQSNKAMFYFSAPYKEAGQWLLNLSGYFPVGLLVLVWPMAFMAFRYCRLSGRRIHWVLLGSNLLGYLVLLGLFGYWRLYAV